MEEEILREKLVALGRIAAGVAHEVNAPLGIIKGSAHNIQESLKALTATLPSILKYINEENVSSFLKLIELSLQPKKQMDSTALRAVKHALARSLSSAGISRGYEVAEMLTEIGIYDDVGFLLKDLGFNLLPLLHFVQDYSAIYRNVQNIDIAAERAAKIVFSIKSYMYVEAEGHTTTIDIPDCLDTILNMHTNQIKHGIEIVKNYQNNPKVLGHQDELNQVWANLLVNAFQAINYNGKVTLEILEENGWAIVKIVDSGPGIPDEIKEKIFTPFFTTKSRGEGTGMGLQISKKIVEKHNGTLDFLSSPGRTEFIVRLPISS